MTTYSPQVSKELLDRIILAESMHDFVLATVPQQLKLDTDERLLVVALFSLTIEHHGAILYLLRSSRFNGSAFALTRPLIDAVYRAIWIHLCATSQHIQSIKNGDFRYPRLPNMADEVEKRMSYTNGLFTILKPFITSLHGYTHGGLEQLARRFDAQGNVCATYDDGSKIEVTNATTAYLVMLAVAWCQIEAGGQPDQEPRSAAIMKRYNELYSTVTCGKPTHCSEIRCLEPICQQPLTTSHFPSQIRPRCLRGLLRWLKRACCGVEGRRR